MQFLIFIGIALAFTGAALIITLKAPLNTSDKLLIAILASFIVKFSLDELSILTDNFFYGALAGILGTSTIITCGWYIKYLTDAKAGFGLRQLYIYTPLGLIAIAVTALPGETIQKPWCTNVLTITLLALIIYYFWFCINMLRKHRQLIRENYSGSSGAITVNWMIIIIVLQVAEFLLKAVLDRVITSYNSVYINIITNECCFIMMTFLLVVLGVWQKSIPIFVPATEKTAQTALQTDELTRYRARLEKFMEEQKPYLDPELTIEKLSELTRIKKLLLSQTLNKSFDKNFFTFIKEYRVRHVEAELKNKNNKDRTILDIAYMSGFNSKSGFHRAFKDVSGKTPTEYMEN